jgi:hypothetical protein
VCACCLYLAANAQIGDSVGAYRAPYCKQSPFIAAESSSSSWIVQPSAPQPALLQIHGDVLYDYMYRSFVDTPYYQKGLSQHTVQANLQIVYKDHLPMRVVIRQRISNSPFFRDRFDLNLGLTDKMLMNRIRQRLTADAQRLIAGRLDSLHTLQKELLSKVDEYRNKANGLRKQLEDPSKYASLVQTRERFIESRVKTLTAEQQQQPDVEELKRQVMKQYDSLIKQGMSFFAQDTVAYPEIAALQRLKAGQKDMEQKLDSASQQLKKVQEALKQNEQLARQALAGVRDQVSLEKYLKENPEMSSSMPKGWRSLMAIKNVGIGRSWVDYSELTVKNISLTGAHAELNPGNLYVAAGVGRVDARYRDFVIANRKRMPAQSLQFVRVGWGRKEGNNIIFTYYSGKRALVNFLTDSAGSTSTPRNKVMGLSIEGQLKLSEHHGLVVEIARSSFSPTVNTERQPAYGKQLFNVSDRSNEAYAVRWRSYFPQTSTTVDAFYRKSGERFQSFNLQPVNSQQESYAVKLKQLFWKKQLQVEAGLRKNDFSNAYLNPGLQSKTVFKSIMATVRVPKYPVLTVGYYPSSQLTLLDNQVLVENQYNTLTGVLSYAYRMKNTGMATNVSYLRFYNQPGDTSFIYYNATSWSVNHSFFLKNLQLQTGFSYAGQEGLKVTTWEQSAMYQLKEWLGVQGGLKYNRVQPAQQLWGGTGGLTVAIKWLGRIQFLYERSYLPGSRRQLLPMDMGRINFYRTF